MKRKLIPVLGWIILIVFFEALSIFYVKDELLFPQPFKSFLKAVDLLSDSFFLPHLASTLEETLVSTFIALAFGAPFGFFVGRSKLARKMLDAPIDWLRSIPATALFPAMLLVFGIGTNTRVAIAVYAAIFAIIIPTIYGASSVDQDRIRHMRRSGLGSVQIFVHVLFWEALSSVLTGTRLATSAALVLIVVGEMFIGSNEGLGYLITFYQQRYETTSMYGCIIIVGLVGYLLNRFIRFSEIRLTHK